MNTIIQNILLFTTLGLAVGYLVKKYFWKSKSKSTKSCGGDDDCGCH